MNKENIEDMKRRGVFNKKLDRYSLENRNDFYRELWDFLGEHLGDAQFPIVYEGIQKLIRKYDFR